MPKFNTRFQPHHDDGVVATGGRTQQHFKEDCDLNTILKRFRLGIPSPASPARYEDLTQQPKDMMDAFERCAKAQEWFESLPSDVRRKFDNDVTQALRLVSQDLNAAVVAGLFPDVSKALSQAAEAAKPEPPKAAEGAKAPVEPPKPPAEG